MRFQEPSARVYSADYRGTSPIRNTSLLGPYHRPRMSTEEKTVMPTETEIDLNPKFGP